MTPTSAATQNVNTDRQSSVSGLTSGTGDTVELFTCSTIPVNNGSAPFTGSNPGGSGNVAQQGNTSGDPITVINGSASGANGSPLVSSAACAGGASRIRRPPRPQAGPSSAKAAGSGP